MGYDGGGVLGVTAGTGPGVWGVGQSGTGPAVAAAVFEEAADGSPIGQ